jgi:hypothetical protein
MQVESKKTASNRGRKRGRKKAAETLDDALYGDLHPDASFLVHDSYFRLSKVPALNEDRDPVQQNAIDTWAHYMGRRIWDAMMQRDHALFEGIARILKDFVPDRNGDWNAVDPLRAEAASIADRQKAGLLPPLTKKQVEEMLAPYFPPNGDKRRSVGRIIEETGIQTVVTRGGRPKGAKNKK